MHTTTLNRLTHAAELLSAFFFILSTICCSRLFARLSVTVLVTWSVVHVVALDVLNVWAMRQAQERISAADAQAVRRMVRTQENNHQ